LTLIDIDIQSISHLGFRPHTHVYTTYNDSAKHSL